ncbi:hypothetical protein ACHAWF_017721 [Thalassiosira exigua]
MPSSSGSGSGGGGSPDDRHDSAGFLRRLKKAPFAKAKKRSKRGHHGAGELGSGSGGGGGARGAGDRGGERGGGAWLGEGSGLGGGSRGAERGERGRGGTEESLLASPLSPMSPMSPMSPASSSALSRISEATTPASPATPFSPPASSAQDPSSRVPAHALLPAYIPGYPHSYPPALSTLSPASPASPPGPSPMFATTPASPPSRPPERFKHESMVDDTFLRQLRGSSSMDSVGSPPGGGGAGDEKGAAREAAFGVAGRRSSGAGAGAAVRGAAAAATTATDASRGGGGAVDASEPPAPSDERSKAGTGRSDADDAFPSAFRGGSDAAVGEGEAPKPKEDAVQAAANNGRGDADDAFSSAFRGKSASASSKERARGAAAAAATAAGNGLDDADDAFLSAFRGESGAASGEPRAQAGDKGRRGTDDGLDEADNAFLSAFRGESGPAPSKSQGLSDADNSFLSAFRGESAPAERRPADDAAAKGNGLSNADNAFLSAFRGGSESAADKTTSKDVAAEGAGRSDADDAFLSAFRGESADAPKKAAGNGRSDADDAFLSAFRGESSGATAAGGNGRSDADDAFLSAFRGEAGAATASKPPKGASAGDNGRSDADNAFLSAFRGDAGAPPPAGGGGKAPSSRDAAPASADLSDADNAFLSAFRGASGDPSSTLTKNPPQACPPKAPPSAAAATTASKIKRAKEKMLANNNAGGDSKDEMAHANAAFLGALHASTIPADDAEERNVATKHADGTFIFNATPKTRGSKGGQAHAKAQTDSDSEFLMAVQSSSSSFFPSSAQQEGNYDSGTLVLNSPKAPAKNKAGGSKDAFMMAIRASGDDDDADVAAPADGENVEVPEEANDALAEDEDEDEDISGLKVPQHAFIEKVMLPRPLFFGHSLPPRVVEEAERAASMHAADIAELETKEAAAETPNNADAEADDSSVVSKSSVSSVSSSFGAGGKKFESPVAPCCRNLEGAMEVFGFGVNPFASDKNREGNDADPGEPAAPHPYVSIYSPVWEQWARNARAKVRRKEAKRLSKVEAAKPSAPSEPSIEARRLSARQKHKKAVSMDFLDALSMSTGEQPSRANTEPTQTSLPQSSAETVETAPSSVSSTETPQDAQANSFCQDQFLRYARGGTTEGDGEAAFSGGFNFSEASASGTFISNPAPKEKSSALPVMDSSTFVQAVKSSDGGSDDDSIEAAEERKAVGLNDNISAAAAMLAGEGADDDAGDENRGISTSMFMAVGGGAKSANQFGRPLSNFELTGGCTPQFSCDDPSLPHESDLGIFETKEEEKRSAERRREKKIIEDFTVPGIMPHLTCPASCSDVDDSFSWNPRVTESDVGSRNGSNTMLISLDGSHSETATDAMHKSPLYETSRIAWWNLPDDYGDTSNSSGKPGRKSKSDRRAPVAEVFPALDEPIPLDTQTNLWPPRNFLRENNMSGTRLHPATSTARFLPHLSDRPPSVRHLQIDTTAVGFPKLGGEIEPVFCKLAIYHLEIIPEKSARSPGHRDTDSVSTGASSYSPSPNTGRCGRVTESLNFDVVQDPVVIRNCKHAIWPYADSDANGLLTSPASAVDDTHSEGTSCGIFPLPANLSISNLYAVLTVHAPMRETSELQHYYKPGRHEHRQGDIPDLETLREGAKTACERYGNFITPIAFGVVPLKHIIDDESPKIPVSRAVQIPLFKYDPDRCLKCIYDHILLMLHPRAQPNGTKSSSMTRGHALLVTRYFGYLGLHTILKRKSSLARERLVDFTGELQVKRKRGKDAIGRNTREKCPSLGETYVLPHWRSQYEVEPARCGGRILPDREETSEPTDSPNSSYAQEIAALPLERSVPESSSRRSKSSHRSNYDGMLLHRSFCNELIFRPQILHKCSKQNIVIKVELRELVWSERLNVEIAKPVKPCIHNTRRGPFLVQEAFSSCAMGSAQFLDEFKAKLPLILGAAGHERMGLLFSVFHFNAKKKKSRRLMSRPNDRSESAVFSIENLGSGFLPLSLENSPTCLIANGDHEVPIQFRVVPLADAKNFASISPGQSSKQHRKKFSFGSMSSSSEANELRLTNSVDSKSEKEEMSTSLLEEEYPEGSVALVKLSGWQVTLHRGESLPDKDNNADDASHVTDESRPGSEGGSSLKGMRSVSSTGDLQRLGSQSESSQKDTTEMAILSVNVIAITSVHPQNKTLAELFLTKPKPPRSLLPNDFTEPYSPWGKYRSEILYRLKPERIPPFNFVGGPLAEMERKLLEPVVSLTKSSKCPHGDLMAHMVRVVAQLWRTAVSGAGEPSILWASPEALIPLRLNAFATLLHTVSSASHHMAKSGLRQLDGNATWDLSALGKLSSMLFDESEIMGGPLEHAQQIRPPSPKKPLTNRPSILSGRAKTSAEKDLHSPRPSIVARYSSEESPTVSDKKTFDVDAMLGLDATPQRSDVTANNAVESVSDDTLAVTSGEAGFKVDSKNDFMSALRTAVSLDDSNPELPRQSTTRADPFIKPKRQERRWMTLPLNALATIQENDGDDRVGSVGDLQPTIQPPKNGDSIDTELVLKAGEKQAMKKFRVPQVAPQVKPSDNAEQLSSFLDSLAPPKQEKAIDDKPRAPEKQRTLPKDDKDIEAAGTAFLDSLSKSMGFGAVGKEALEEKRVGAAHHRKTRSRCTSIDWSLPQIDTLLEKDQQAEQINRARTGDTAPAMIPLSTIDSFPDESSSDDDMVGNESGVDSSGLADTRDISAIGDGEESDNKVHPLKRHRHQRSTSSELSRHAEAVVLPDSAERMSAMKNDGNEKRWWPYVYEVIIHQWVALLDEQTKKVDNAGKKSDQAAADTSGLSPIVVKYLSHAAKAARGATVRCAPFLLDIIKQSLSWRVDCVFRPRKSKRPSLDEANLDTVVSPHVKLDENTCAALEKLIKMLTDASIDSRNFDSFEYRKISIDVNDAVVRFIRDLFSVLDVQQVHRFVLVYFSRFVSKEGKHWHDRDSKVTGLRCSWETTKLRLNAIALFVRFPEFMAVCSPIMESWVLPDGSPANSARRFFSDALEKINRLGLSEFTAPEGPVSKETITIPRMKPHWLAELCTDICLSATGHAEESIQFRASSLLFELFWLHSQQGRVEGNISVVASIFVPFVPKLLSHVDYLSSLPAKGQLRKDILPCALFVLQSAPIGLMRALWRKLAKRAEGKTMRSRSADKYGGIIGSESGIGYTFSALPPSEPIDDDLESDGEVDIFDMFGLLNLSLATIAYEGSAHYREGHHGSVTEYDEKPIWRREYLLSNHAKASKYPRTRPLKPSANAIGETDNLELPTASDSRKWHAHDCSLVVISMCRQIVREILGMLQPHLGTEDTNDGDVSYAGSFASSVAGSYAGSRSLSDIFLQPTSSSLEEHDPDIVPDGENGKAARPGKHHRKGKVETLTFAVNDTIIFVRAAASVYLHALTMKQSDIVITKTLTAAVEIVKIFGIKLFLAAVGETMQHWMRVILEHCGARRAELRVDACEFLNLLLRLTWESYGSFSRIRLPLLAVQCEVMERIVAIASKKYTLEQQRLGFTPIALSNDSAEASLTPLWRTIDRLHNQSASQNLSFKSALARLAIKMKDIYRAYLAAHALAIVNRSESGSHGSEAVSTQSNAHVQRMRVSVHRIVSNSSWFSKRFLGYPSSATLDRSMIQFEAVEDSFLVAANVFSSTELPSHRVAWLQKLSEFHGSRGRFAEEATCRCIIYHTYREAARQHDHSWSSSPFLPWASSSMDSTHPGNEGHAIVSAFESEIENLSGGSGKLDRGTAFRRIFYRAVDSVRMRSGDWGAVSGGKYLFYGVTLKSEFDSVTPWYSYREMEENMVEEAEISGDLFLRAGIVESSRYAWSLANQFYSETFNYARLAYVYRRLALVVTSQVPIVDVSNQLELSSQIGRFYKVYFHGGAPDDLLHSQGSEGFIYRVPNSVQIKDFASRLENSLRSILPAKTMIDLTLDDGSPMAPRAPGGKRSGVIGGSTIEPVKIKITPLRPLFRIEDEEQCFRGTPEWFQLKADKPEFEADGESGKYSGASSLSLKHQRSQSCSASNSLSSVGSVTMSSKRSNFRSAYRKSSIPRQNLHDESDKHGLNGELIGADKFYFTQPMKRDPARGFRDWLNVPKARIAERSLRVTELQVENCFPACITRQKILHRAVFTQSPLEASVEAVSTWCSVLFRTVIATNGQGVLGGQRHQGLSADSAKLVMECIHSSGVKRIGLTFLTVNVQLEQSSTETGVYSPYESLDEDDIERVQTKLARMIVTFLELLHLLIARNRDVLLAVVQARKRGRGDASSVASGSVHGYAATLHVGQSFSPMKRHSERGESVHGYNMYGRSSSELVGRSIIAENHSSHGHHNISTTSDRTDSAIGVQSELQRGLISLVKTLLPKLLDTLTNEVPRWMRSCCQDNYFSSGLHRNADIPIGEELFFNVDTSGDDDRGSKSEASCAVPRSIIRGSGHPYRESSPNNSLCSGTSSRRIDRALSGQGSERPPTERPHRRNISGTSYCSMKSGRSAK